MPHLRFRSVTKEVVEKLSSEINQPLAEMISTSADNFTFEWIASEFYFNQKPIVSYPFVEVLWFPRSQEVAQKVSQYLTEVLKKQTAAEDVVVVFINLDPKMYFENGKSF